METLGSCRMYRSRESKASFALMHISFKRQARHPIVHYCASQCACAVPFVGTGSEGVGEESIHFYDVDLTSQVFQNP
jgi:hypothetical protein